MTISHLELQSPTEKVLKCSPWIYDPTQFSEKKLICYNYIAQKNTTKLSLHNVTNYDECAKSRWSLSAILIFVHSVLFIQNCRQFIAELNIKQSDFDILSRSKVMTIYMNSKWRLLAVLTLNHTQKNFKMFTMSFRILHKFLKI